MVSYLCTHVYKASKPLNFTNTVQEDETIITY